MSLPVATFRPDRATPWLRSAAAKERSTNRRVALCWAFLMLNTLTYYPQTWSGEPLVIHVPSVIGKLVTQGALVVALLLALTVNRRIVIRPNVYLCLLSLLAVEACMSAGQADHIGTLYRTVRLVFFIATIWLLSPWWGRRDLLLVRAHLAVLYVVLGSVLVGLLIAPHTAYAQHRLAGALWPNPPTQVAEFAAVTTGIVLVLWLGGVYSGRFALPVAAISIAILLLSHTRTALVGMVAGLLVAGLSLFAVHARVRKLFASASVVISVAAITASGFITTWLARGENSKELTNLTGRTTVWKAVVNTPRDRFQDLFGFGLSNKSFNGLPIDSNWLATYLDLGLIGAIISGIMVLYLLISAFFQPRGVSRALGLFLVTFCLAASFTEVGFSDATTYLLHLTLAASLLVHAPDSRTT